MKGEVLMKTTPRAAVVYCSPTKARPNSTAKSSPHSRPGHPVPSMNDQRMPRQRIQPSSSVNATTLRIASCTSTGTSGIAALIETWFRPHRKQHSSRLSTAVESRWSRREVGAAARVVEVIRAL